MASDSYPLLYPAVAVPLTQGIPTEGPASHPQGPPASREYSYEHPSRVQFSQSSSSSSLMHNPPQHHSQSPKPDPFYPSGPSSLFPPPQQSQSSQTEPSPLDQSSASTGAGANHYPSSTGVPRLPPILQVEKQQVTTSATQLASASRRRNEAHFVCPVPGCGSTFTRRFNLRGHLRSHTEERPYVCEWPGCKKGFARQHDCKRHQALHAAKSQSNICQGCKKTFSRLDALNRHLRSDGGAECRASNPKFGASASEENQPIANTGIEAPAKEPTVS
ncbi:hypothetical protein CPB84DRAFT_1773121 [Gymnopilus junonius]|uniref:C2H2-type domain-containing protein n=1 Tax=Gymnopilus junonius TaxID=109634 RepID=A0A9P5NUQ4_GYMJU|nr:hypothetical protein CPB84DRAFT_1773121 [Gymnopilus junonius]